ncbi:hypothetical protein QF017_000949 [Pseudomonas laurylsulfatiphila]
MSPLCQSRFPPVFADAEYAGKREKAPVIEGARPGYSLDGKSSRYDIYPLKNLKLVPTIVGWR